MNFLWFVEEKVAGLVCPSNDGVTYLANQGIKTIINLVDRPRVSRYTEKAKILGMSRKLWTPFLFPRSVYFEIFGPPALIIYGSPCM